MDCVETDLLARNPLVPRRAVTVDDCHRMVEVGILSEDDRVELMEGNLVAMSPIGTERGELVKPRVRHSGGRSGCRISLQNPLHLSDRTEPQPDLIVLGPRPDHCRKAPARPEDVLLLIEIVDSSLEYDRSTQDTASRNSGSWTLVVRKWRSAGRRQTLDTPRSSGLLAENLYCRRDCRR
jgi:hypothetical protein